MMAATYTQGAGFAIEALDPPAIGAGELLIRVMAASICGTDLRIRANGHRKLREGQKVVLGHEFAGQVERVGAGVFGYAPGMRVGVAPNIGCGRCELCARGEANLCPEYQAFGITFDGAHAPFVRVPREAIQQGNVIPLPDTLGWAEAALIEPLSCVVNGMRNCQLKLGDVVLIFGAGPIGLMHLLLASVGGAARMFMVDTNDLRLAQARKAVPSVITLNPNAGDLTASVLALNDGRKADVVVTACSVPAVQQQALDLLAPHGRLSLFGGLPKDSTGVLMNTNLIHYQNLLVTGTTGGPLLDYRTALKMVVSKRIDLSPIISHRLPAERMEEAYHLAGNGEAMKVVLLFGD